jgi:predicted nucleic acid-binding protein
MMMFNYYTVAEQVGLDRLYPRLFIVMDTNQVLSYIIARARNRSHPLDQLLSDEYAYISAPQHIEVEVSNHMHEIAAEKKLDINKIWAIWNTEIRPRIDIRSNISKWAWMEASTRIGRIDPDDAPFLALYLDMGADVILSRDGHIRDIMGSRAWTPGRAKWASVRIREGVVSLFVIHPVGTNAARALGIIAWTVLDSLMWLLESIIEAIKAGVERVITWFLELPGWLKAVIIGSALALYYRYRDGIHQKVDDFIAKLIEWANLLAGLLDRVVTWINFKAAFLGGLLVLLLKSVMKGTEELIVLRYSWTSFH